MTSTELQNKLDAFTELVGITEAVLALYDTDDLAGYAPVVKPGEGECCWAFYDAWHEGTTLALSKDNYGCRGAGRYLAGGPTPPEAEMANFLYKGEGLKASLDITKDWMKEMWAHKTDRQYTLIGPFRPERYDEISTITFLVSPDQLSALIWAAEWQRPEGVPGNIVVTIAAGCGMIDPFLAIHHIQMFGSLVITCITIEINFRFTCLPAFCSDQYNAV